jgi:hypothetical protein
VDVSSVGIDSGGRRLNAREAFSSFQVDQLRRHDMESTAIESQVEQLLPWHRPQVQRLVISTETRSEPFSGGTIDLETGGG